MKFRVCLLISLLSLGCTAAQYAEQADEVVEVPDTFLGEGGSAKRVGFCSDFGEPELDKIMSQVLESNLDLMSSYARLDQAKAIARLNDASLYPNVSADISAGRAKNPAPAPVGSVESNSFRASVGAAYELDLWGKLHHNRKAAEKGVEASQADFETLNISIATQTILSFFDLTSQREKRKLFDQQIELSENFLELTTMRFQQGRANALDLTQQRQQVESLRGRLALIDASEKTAFSQLALLSGKPIQKFTKIEADKMPQIPALPSIGLPADLIESRPDLRSALLRMEQADHQTKAAAAEMLPSIRLSANIFLQAANIEDIIEDVFWSIAGAVSQQLFTGGRVSAQVQQAEAAARSQVYAFGQTYLRALKEIEDALVLEAAQRKYITSIDKQIVDAKLGLQIARDRYQSGVGDYLRVLNSLQSVQQLEQARIDAKKQELIFRVSLCRSLGGDWVRGKSIKEKLKEDEGE